MKRDIQISASVRNCSTRLLTLRDAAFSDFSVSGFAQTIVTIVASDNLLLVDAIAVFNAVTTVVIFALIDIYSDRSRVDYSVSTDLRAELRESPRIAQ